MKVDGFIMLVLIKSSKSKIDNIHHSLLFLIEQQQQILLQTLKICSKVCFIPLLYAVPAHSGVFNFFVIFTLKRPYIYTLFGGFLLQIALNLLEYVLFYLFHLHALPFSNIPCVGTS